MSDPYPIDLDELRAWLLAHEPVAVVGMSCDDGGCPLACFLNQQYADSTFYVNTTEYRRSMDDVSLGCEPDAVFLLPTWAQGFVFLVDESAFFSEDIPVSAFDALWMLSVSCAAAGVPLEV